MTLELSKKLSTISPSVTLAITAKANAMKAEGIDVISFGAGEPDFNTPVFIQDAGIDAIKTGKTRYTPASGLKILKEAICNKLKSDNDLEYTPSNIVVSNGAKHSIYNTLNAILNEGDEVIVPVPYWVSYPELVKLAGGEPKLVQVKEEDHFKYSIELLNEALTNKTKAIFVNSPNNPTGTAYSKEELILIGEWAVKNEVFILSDEIYEKLVYDGTKHISIASLNKAIKEQTIIINGMSKAYAMTGWRIGYTAANEEITKMMSNFQSHATSNPCSISQYASIKALNTETDEIEKMRQSFEQRRNIMVDLINELPNVSCNKPLGAFYVMANISKWIGKEINGTKINSSVEFASALLSDKNVAVIPGAAFGDDRYIRLSYAISEDAIREGIDRINTFLK